MAIYGADDCWTALLSKCRVYVVEQDGKMYIATSPHADKERQGYTLAFLQMQPWWGVAQADRRPSDLERKLAAEFCEAINRMRGHHSDPVPERPVQRPDRQGS